MKNAFGALFVVALVVIFLLLICKPRVKNAVDDPAMKALIKAKDDTIALYRQVRSSDSIAINEAQQKTAEVYQISEVYRLSMNEKQGIIYKLVAKIEGARMEPKDSSWITVSPHYIEGCDTLVSRVVDLNNKIDDYEEANLELNKLLHYEISVRDSALNNERTFNAKFQSQLNNCMAQLQGKVTAKQRAQLYFGIGMLGNKINPLSGGQINVSLRARNSQIYEVTGMMVGNTWYGGVGTKILITFKK